MGFIWVGTKAKTPFLAAMKYRGQKVWGKKVKPIAVKHYTKHTFDVKLKY